MTEAHDATPEPEAAVDLFIEFVNTLEFEDGEPIDHVGDPGRLADWLRSHDLAGGRLATSRVKRAAPGFRDLRDLTRDVIVRLAEGRDPTDVQTRRLNAVLRAGLHYHQLRRAGPGARFTVGQVGDDLEQAMAAIAGSLAHYVADHDLRRLRVCADDGCRWLFVDTSPAGRRRWCDMRTCGNRAKVARHRARTRSGPSARGSTPG